MKLYAAIVFAGILLAASYGASLNHIHGTAAETKPPEGGVIGYCPTVRSDAMEVAGSMENTEIIGFGSASAALGALREGTINSAIIGRKAKPHELPGGAAERTLRDGYTLVFNKKAFIDSGQLSGMGIHTAVDRAVSERLLPESEILYHESTREAKAAGLERNDPVLVPWEEFGSGDELLVVMKGSLKDKRFRGAFWYLRD